MVFKLNVYSWPQLLWSPLKEKNIVRFRICSLLIVYRPGRELLRRITCLTLKPSSKMPSGFCISHSLSKVNDQLCACVSWPGARCSKHSGKEGCWTVNQSLFRWQLKLKGILGCCEWVVKAGCVWINFVFNTQCLQFTFSSFSWSFYPK